MPDNANDRQTRRQFSAADKVTILKRHLVEGTPVSQLCEEFGIKPNLFYSWQRLLFENAQASFDNGRRARSAEDAKDHKIEQLEAKLQRKHEVLSELMEEHVQLKKNAGDL